GQRGPSRTREFRCQSLFRRTRCWCRCGRAQEGRVSVASIEGAGFPLRAKIGPRWYRQRGGSPWTRHPRWGPRIKQEAEDCRLPHHGTERKRMMLTPTQRQQMRRFLLMWRGNEFTRNGEVSAFALSEPQIQRVLERVPTSVDDLRKITGWEDGGKLANCLATIHRFPEHNNSSPEWQ
ncbi:unnamed protein product, partial [Ectocarpus sp. 8 AP-2014]